MEDVLKMEERHVQVWARGKCFQVRFAILDPVYGRITLYSDCYDSPREADTRAMAIARVLGFTRDTLPVHGIENAT